MTSTPVALAASPSRSAPGPRGLAAFRTLRQFIARPLATLGALHARHGDVFRLHLPPLADYVSVLDPGGIHRFLVENHANYVKSPNYDGIRAFVGQGLLTSEGEVWRRHRRMAQPAFHRDRIAALVERMSDETARTLAGLGPGRVELDVHQLMMKLTLTIVGRTLFDYDLSGEADGVGPAVTRAIDWANRYTMAIIRTPRWLPTPGNRGFARAKRTLDGLIGQIIAERRARLAGGAPASGDLMDLLMEARDEDGGAGLTDAQLRDEVMTLVMAGHETTANALSWLLWLLARHPTWQERLRDEARSVLGDRLPTFADLPRLGLTLQAIQEALRLYPPVWVFERAALEADEVAGYHIPKGAAVGVCAYYLHRQPSEFPDPERFDPERFAPSVQAARSKFAYLPFGGGPRVCIGNQFALAEAQVIAAMLLARYRVTLDETHVVEPEPTVTLRPRTGVRARLEPIP